MAGALEKFDPEAMPPELRSLVTRLAEEVDRLTGKLERSRRRIAELETLADEDSLVPVLNRRGFMRELRRAIAFTARYGTPVAFIYVDLDDFKSINDRFGHVAGDTLLSSIGTVLRRELRSSDVVGRLGGDEFGIILWNALLVDAARKGVLLAEAIARHSVSSGAGEISVGASAGATAIIGEDTPEAALSRADAAMYVSKSEAKAGPKR